MHPRPKPTLARYRFGAFVLDPAKRELQRDGVALVLPARVFECLHYLIEHRDRAVDRDELVRAVFARADVSDAQLAQIVLRARRAIGDDGQEQRVIRTVPRFGFRWAEPVTEVHDEDEAPTAAVDTPVVDEALPAPTELPVDATAIDTPAPPPPARQRSGAGRWRIVADCGAALAAMLVLALSVVPWPLPSVGDARAHVAERGAIIVLPMEVSGDSDAAWAKLGMMDFLIDRMRRARLPVWSSEATLDLLRSPDRGTDRQWLHQHADAAWVVQGQARNDNRQWQVVLTATDDAGTARRGIASHADLVGATRLAADKLLATFGSPRPGGKTEASDLDERLQRAQAAVLANQLDTARRILLEAPEPQRSTPLLQYRLAMIDLRAGRHPAALAATDRLLRTDTAHRDRSFRGQLLALQGALLVRLDRPAEAERSFDEAIPLLDPAADTVELAGALIGRGVSHAAKGEFDAALADLGRARIQLGRAGGRMSVAWVDANLGTLEMQRGRPLQAVQHFDKAERDFAKLGAISELAGVRYMLTAAHLQLLQNDAALAVNERAWALRDQVRDPSQLADLILVRSEVLAAKGRLREARELLRMPAAEAAAQTDFRRREYLQMELARQAGDARSTAVLAGAALRDWPADRNSQLRAWMAYRQAEAAFEAELPAPDPSPLAGDALAGQLGAALRERRAGHAAAAEGHYREALSLAESGGVPEQVADTVQAQARWLMESGRLDEATALIGRVVPWAEQDFELALLQVELYRRLHQAQEWRRALDHAQRLAGERPIPAELSLAWQPGKADTFVGSR